MTVRIPLLPKSVRWSLVAAIAAGIFYASVTANPHALTPGSATIHYASVGVDKWGHFAAYTSLAFASAYATADWELGRWQTAALVVGSTVGYGAALEVLQYFLPERTFSVVDIAANALGASLVFPWYLVRPYVELAPVSEW